MLISEVYDEYITKYPDKKCSENIIMQELIAKGYSPIEILDLIDYMKKYNWQLDNNNESKIKENYYKDAINEKISSLEILLSELENYYKQERINICDMDDIELSQELFSELCNKITKLKKPAEKLSVFRNSIDMFFNNKCKVNTNISIKNSDVEKDFDINDKQSYYNIKVGKLAKLLFTDLIKSNKIPEKIMNMFFDKKYSSKTLKSSYPIFSFDNNALKNGGHTKRYYAKPVGEFNNKMLYLTSQWYEEQREILINWYETYI